MANPGGRRDTASSRRPRSGWPSRVLLGVATVVLVADLGAVWLYSRDDADRVPALVAVERFRQGQGPGDVNGHEESPTGDHQGGSAPAATSGPDGPTTPQTTVPTGRVAAVPSTPSAAAPTAQGAIAGVEHGPAPGVYRYETEGGERLDALGGSAHTYPSETTITVTETACGFATRWDALEQRWEEGSHCVDGGAIAVAGGVSFHSFFGVSDERQYECDADAAFLLPPPGSQPGARWVHECSGGDGPYAMRQEFVGIERQSVAGAEIDALHVRSSWAQPAGSQNRAVHDSWFHPSTGLLLRHEWHVSTVRDSPMGRVHYVEDVELRLQSLTPLR